MSVNSYFEKEVESCSVDSSRRVWFITSCRNTWRNLETEVIRRRISRSIKVSYLAEVSEKRIDRFIDEHRGWLFNETYCDLNYSKTFIHVRTECQFELSEFIAYRTDHYRGKVHVVEQQGISTQ